MAITTCTACGSLLRPDQQQRSLTMRDGRSHSLRVAQDRVQEPETSLHVQSTQSLAKITDLRTKYETVKAENVELRAQVESLSRPKTYEELQAAYDARIAIAARAKPPEQP